MTSSAKTTFSIDDRSTTVASLEGISVGLTVVSSKGVPFKEKLITTAKQLTAFAGDPHPSLGSTLYAAKRYLSEGNSLWLSRATSDDAKCSAALVRSKVSDMPMTPVTSIKDTARPIVGLTGLGWDDVASYVFPTYLGNRTYEDTGSLVLKDTTATNEVEMDLLPSNVKQGDKVSFHDLSLSAAELGDLNSPATSYGEDVDFYTVDEVIDTEVEKETLTLSTAVTAPSGTEIKYLVDTTPTSYSPAIYTQEDAVDTLTLVVNDSDLIDQANHTLDIDGQSTTVDSKNIITVPYFALKIDNSLIDVTLGEGLNVLVIEQYEFEDRDALLIYNTPGTEGNRISIGIEEGENYDNEFQIVVYLDGAEAERFACTRDYFVDGFGSQMFVEDVVNGVSNWIRVLNNENDIDPDGEFEMPIITDSAVWLQDPEDVFLSTEVNVTEDVLVGHNQLWVDDIKDLSMGDRIKIFDKDDEELGEEYKITKVEGSSVILDRVSTQNYELDNGLVVYRFESTYDNEEEGIKDGIKIYAPTVLDKVFPANHIGDSYSISGMSGTLVDTGVSYTLGGSNGGAVTVGNMIKGLNVLKSPGRTPVNLIDDGGTATPEFAQAVYEVVKNQVDCHGMLSSPGNLEDYTDAPQRIVEYRNSLGLDTNICSLFSGWVRKFDAINQVNVWECPSIHATNAQSFVTRERTIFTPAAGNVNGKVVGLDIRYKFEEGERDLLITNNINPLKYDNGTITIWGNETLQKRPSPLQLRSVNMLIIAVQVGVRSLNEYKLFDFNNESTWSALEGGVNAFIRDSFKSKGGVYDYQVSISDVITDGDIDARRMPLFIGLQPTLDIKTIPTTIAIYNKSSDIEVSL